MNDLREIDDLRARLRALGYLDAPVDRFVLGGGRSTRAAPRIALAAGLRIGLLAGVLLGPAAAIGLASRAPGLITTVMDSFVLAAYLSVPFGMASALLATGAILLAGWFSTRRSRRAGPSRSHGRTASLTGVIVALASLVYLTLWWRAAVPADALGAQVLALTVAVAIALLIGHAVTLGVLAYLVRGGIADLPSGSPLSSARLLIPLGVFALGGAVVLARTLTPTATTVAASPVTVVPTGYRVTVVAIDGLDVDTLTRLRAAGSLPTFDRIMSGALATLPPFLDRDPAQVWTTIATGQPVDRHGIRSLESRQLAGVEGRVPTRSRWLAMLTAATDLVRLTSPAIASGTERHMPAFWEVAATAGLRTAVVHWWATWPAVEHQLGAVLSDRAILRLEQGGTQAAEIAPDSLYADLLTSASTRTARIAGLSTGVAEGVSPEAARILDRSARLDATVAALATDQAIGRTDLLALYLPGLDIAHHALFTDTQGRAIPASTAADRLQALEAYYRYLDRLVGTLVRPSDERHIVALVGQPGRVADPTPGVFAISASQITREVRLKSVAAEAVAPSILRLLGLPVAQDLEARSAEEMWTDGFRQAHPLRTVATYGGRSVRQAPVRGQPLDREMIERMRSLGYVR